MTNCVCVCVYSDVLLLCDVCCQALCVRVSERESATNCVCVCVCVCSDNVSLLCDLCRQAIVFEKLSDMLTCLRLITNDPQVRACVCVRERVSV